MAGISLPLPNQIAGPYEAQLVAAIVDSLAMHLMENARFLAERLNAEFPNEDNAYLLGVSNYWCDKAYAAYEVLRGCNSPQSRYLFALSCLKLGKYHEGENVLEAHGPEVPNGAYGHFLLGQIAKLTNRHERAKKHYQNCLTLNPMLWCAHDELCKLGAYESATDILNSPEAQANPAATLSAVIVFQDGTSTTEERRAPIDGQAAIASAAPDRDQGSTQKGRDDQSNPALLQRTTVCPTLPMRLLGKNSLEGQAGVVNLLRALGAGHALLAQYKSKEAIEAFSALPCQHYQTSWVLSNVGRAYFEMVDYAKACQFFVWSRNHDPHRLDGLEWYSTVLWHMKKEVDLSHLAQDALSLDRLSPQTWCVMGNCFSLQKEHETALLYFKRALQIDPNFTYAYTLCGHEYFANEDFDKSLAFYRNAITRDPRHYNAWYGIGQIYYRQEKYDMAINNFKHALTINKRSSILQCYLGMAYHKQGRMDQALRALRAAISADPQNPLARFEHASVLISQEHYEDAIGELEELKDIAPREATVYLQIGKIYKKLKKPDMALTNFCHAMDLKPASTDQNLLKSAIEKLHVDDDDADDEI